MRFYNIPVFVPHKGCPHDCSFCNQKRITGQNDEQSTEEIHDEIKRYIDTFEEKRYAEIAFFGGSFTGIEEEKQIELLEMAYEFVKNGQVDGIRLSTRPDYINKHILDYLKKYGVTAIELGVQSMSEEVLKKNNRGHNVALVEKSAELIKSYGCFSLGLQQMIGLYGSTPESDILSAKKIAALSPETVRIYPTIVLEGTHLARLFDSGEYTPYTLEQAVEVGSRAYDIYLANNIKVIRMGLQATELINEKGNICGPYHSSYGELVKSRCLRRKVETCLKDRTGKVTVLVNPAKISQFVGNKRENMLYYKEKLGLDVKIQPESKTEDFEVI